MRHDEKVRKSNIPAHYPVGVLEKGIPNRIPDRLRGPLIGRDEGAAVYLILGSPMLALAELVSHWLIDYGKCANRYGIHADQGAHLACKLLWAILAVQGFAA